MVEEGLNKKILALKTGAKGSCTAVILSWLD